MNPNPDSNNRMHVTVECRVSIKETSHMAQCVTFAVARIAASAAALPNTIRYRRWYTPSANVADHPTMQQQWRDR